MSSFQVRCRGNRVFQEQLRQLSTQSNTSITELVRLAIDAQYGKELSKFQASALFVVDGGSSVNQFTTNEPELEQAS